MDRRLPALEQATTAAIAPKFTRWTELQTLLDARLAAQISPARAAALSGIAHHAAAVATEFGASDALVAAIYLHNFVCNDLLDLAEVSEFCGARVAWLAAEAQRLLHEPGAGPARGKARARQRVRHFVAAYRDPELALLAVATLCGKWRSVRQGAAAQRHAFAEEGRHVLSPLLEMLGMRALREEVDAWLWRLHEPDAARIEQNAQTLFADVARQLQPEMPGAELVCRPCTPLRMGEAPPAPRSTGKLYPPLDLTVLVEDEAACYRALYWIHRLFQAVDGGVVDYLRDGRINGARALQTTTSVLFDHQRLRVTFHICTHAMDEVNRWGLAAIVARTHVTPDLPSAWWNGAADDYLAIASAPIGTLPEVLYVFSPQGQLFRFHRGCTVVDYAYHLHTDLADQCQRFYINDEVVEPTTPLYHLDLVALEHDPRAPGPTKIWLNAAHTSRARNHIERILKRRGLGIDQGQKILDQRLRVLEAHYGFNLPAHRLPQATVTAVRQFKLSRVDELLAEIAAGRIVADRILHPLFADEIIRQIRIPQEIGLRPHQLQMAQCCRPRPGEDIVGLPSRRQGEIHRLRIHRANCRRLVGEDEQIVLKWRLQPRLASLAQLEMTAHDEEGLLGEALSVFYAQRSRMTLKKVEAAAELGVARIRFTLEAESNDVIEQIIDELLTLPGRMVVEVRTLRLPPSELEFAQQLGVAGHINPYSRMPVHEQAMFFGRSRELLQISEWLHAGVGNVWLIGQKRVGKTSLLLHLKNYYLKERGFVPAFVDFQLLGNLATSNIFFEIANAVYDELQTDPRIGHLGAPLRGVFDDQPPVQLIAYLRTIGSRLGTDRLVLLLDEFSRTTDAYQAGELNRSFFAEWRGLLQATARDVAYLAVFQQQTFDTLAVSAQPAADDLSRQLMELGETLTLKALDRQDVRRLIEWPMRNFLEYSQASLEQVVELTGGSPFLIQSFCAKLTTHMARQDRRQVELSDLAAVSAEFMSPTESLFAHLRDILKGSGHQVAQHVARLAETEQPVTWATLTRTLSHYPPDKLRRTLVSLTDNDILLQPTPESWQFAGKLFQQWLALNPE